MQRGEVGRRVGERRAGADAQEVRAVLDRVEILDAAEPDDLVELAEALGDP